MQLRTEQSLSPSTSETCSSALGARTGSLAPRKSAVVEAGALTVHSGMRNFNPREASHLRLGLGRLCCQAAHRPHSRSLVAPQGRWRRYLLSKTIPTGMHDVYDALLLRLCCRQRVMLERDGHVKVQGYPFLRWHLTDSNPLPFHFVPVSLHLASIFCEEACEERLHFGCQSALEVPRLLYLQKQLTSSWSWSPPGCSTPRWSSRSISCWPVIASVSESPGEKHFS